MKRRAFLGVAAGAFVSPVLAQAEPIPVIDAHIHLYDPERPGGVPWPPPGGPIPYRTMLPKQYREVIQGFPVVGAMEVECSFLLEDNQWVLDVAGQDPIMVGTVGNLQIGGPEFGRQLERFHRNPLYRGIRQRLSRRGNVMAYLENPAYVASLKLLAEADLTLNTSDPSLVLLQWVVRATDLVPDLRVVLDHLPQYVPPDGDDYRTAMRELGQRPLVYAKVSEVLRRVNGRVPHELSFYTPRLDEIFETFGPDRLLYGSDWPNADQWAPFPVAFTVVHEYFESKGRAAAEKYFWRNSVAAYKWAPRSADQQRLLAA